jgi:hypothetical protein
MMDFLRQLLFESLPLLLIAEVIALTVVIAVHRRRLTPASRRGVWISLAVCLLLIGIQQIVVTDREALETLVRGLAQAADHGDMAAMDARIDPAFRVGPTDKARMLDIIKQRLQEWQVDEPRINALTVKMQGDEAEVRFRVICDLRSSSQDQASVPSYWQIRCARSDGEWRMVSIEEAEMGPGVFTRQGGLDLMGYLNLRR